MRKPPPILLLPAGILACAPRALCQTAQRRERTQASCLLAFGRAPNTDEIRHWESQGALSCLMLVACRQDWPCGNGNNAPKTSGGLAIPASTPALSVVRVSPAIANEARATAGLVSTNGGNVIAAAGGN